MSAIIAYDLSRSIRKMDREQAATEITRQLIAAGSVYGIECPETPVMAVLVSYIIQDFQTLMPAEIEQAFRLAATRKIDVSLETYGKPMTYTKLGELLTAYRAYRNKMIKRQHQQDDQHRLLLQTSQGGAPSPEMQAKLDAQRERIAIKNKSKKYSGRLGKLLREKMYKR